MKPEDNLLHPCPSEADPRYWCDTMWLDVVDRQADVFAVFHFHFVQGHHARVQANFLIGGKSIYWGTRYPFNPEPDSRRWSDGTLTLEVVIPFKELRIQFDSPHIGCDLAFRGRFPEFDYANSPGGDISAAVAHVHGGHYDQAMICTGSVQFKSDGDEIRLIDSFASRDHTWSQRFSNDLPLDMPAPGFGHFYPNIQLPARHIQALIIPPSPLSIGLVGDEQRGLGFISDADGSRPLRSAKVVPRVQDGDLEHVTRFNFEFVTLEDEVLHVSTGSHYGTLRSWQVGTQNLLERRVDDIYPFVDFVVEETGEQGYGAAEYSLMPPINRWVW
jgi:hypothetical protein